MASFIRKGKEETKEKRKRQQEEEIREKDKGKVRGTSVSKKQERRPRDYVKVETHLLTASTQTRCSECYPCSWLY